MDAMKLYVVPGSHSSMAGRLMLEHKRLDYRRIDLLPAIHKPLLRALRFAATTVPALRIGERRLQGTLTISRALEELRPEPPLFPTDEAANAAVQDAERWGEAVLQPVPRRLSWWAFAQKRSSLRSFADGADLHVPLGLAIRTAAPIVAVERRINGASDDAVRADMAALPAMLDQVEQLLDAGTPAWDLCPARRSQLPGARPAGRPKRVARSRRSLEHEPVVIQQLPLEADLVRADA
jgi:glutathione S-transferase